MSYRRKESLERYQSPYSRANLGNIPSTSHLPQLKLRTRQIPKKEQNQDQIKIVNENIFDVKSDREAIGFFAKQYRDKVKALDRNGQKTA